MGNLRFTTFLILLISGIVGTPVANGGSEGPEYIEVPSEISKEDVIELNRNIKKQLDLLTSQKLSEWTKELRIEEREKIDLIIVYTKNGEPILPDYDRQKAKVEISLTNEINFTFNSPEYPWTGSELASLQAWLNDFYPVGKEIYGNAAFNITVNVRKNPNIGWAGTYNPSTNEITLKYLDDDVLCHEMVHAFHDDNIIGLTTYEEGMTRAAEVEIFNQLDAYTHWDENHSYSIDIYYEHDNQPDVAGKDGQFWWGFINVLLRYQQAGYAWAKAYLEDNNFFVNFNQMFYARAFEDPLVKNNESDLKDIVRNVKAAIEGDDFDTWYSKQNIFNSNPESGYKLLMKADMRAVYYFYRDSDGLETMQPNATIDWSVYDCNDDLLDSGSVVTNHYGAAPIDEPNTSIDYQGRISVKVSTDSPEGEITSTFFRGFAEWTYYNNYSGVFGIVKNQNSGSISITPLDNPALQVDTTVINGEFSFPSLEHIRGPFSVIFSGPINMQVNRIFNKDASHYFLIIDDSIDGDCPNLDGLNPVDFIDFSIFASDWELTEPNLLGDLNNNGTVDVNDLAILAIYWLSDCY